MAKPDWIAHAMFRERDDLPGDGARQRAGAAGEPEQTACALEGDAHGMGRIGLERSVVENGDSHSSLRMDESQESFNASFNATFNATFNASFNASSNDPHAINIVAAAEFHCPGRNSVRQGSANHLV